VGYDDKQISLGKKETGARAALPIWMQFMRAASADKPAIEFANVVPLEQQAADHQVHVDTPDTAPTEDEPHSPKEKSPAPIPPAPSPPPVKTSTSAAAANSGAAARP
jgi:penicillin-binding protein 1A